jgi:hypothetical protein
VVRKALEKAREESVLERALREGMSATEAFARYGICRTLDFIPYQHLDASAV